MTNAVNLASAAGTGFFRNRIINGDMAINQRGSTVTLAASGQYGVDRFFGTEDSDGTMTMQQSSVAPPGFTSSLLLTTGTADASLAATQYVITGQAIEGLNIADLGWGTANAQTVTVSFWVRSSLTGTFGGAIKNSAGNRSYAFTYPISAANTWEYKTVTIPGDTTGTWLTTNGTGLYLTFGLGSGSTYAGTPGAWTAANYISASGTVSVIGTAGATFYITGVQFEVGSVATPFERRPYGLELALCQRYYETGSFLWRQYAINTNDASETYPFKVTKRAAPSLTYQTTFNNLVSTYDVRNPTVDKLIIYAICNSTGTIGLDGTFTANAEL